VIDTHCHLLPGLDDGPLTLPRSLDLARALVADGVEHVVCTPHFSRHYLTEVESALDALRTVVGALTTAGIDLRLSLAAEVGSTFAAVRDVADLRARAFGRRFVLVELERAAPEPVLDTLVERILAAGLVPVLGHPERSAFVQRNPAQLDQAIAAGALVQVVAPSLVAGPESRSAGAAWRLLDSGRVDLIASDAHDLARRPPRLRAAARLVERRYGPDVANRLTTANPGELVAGRHPRG
jgi:protein-tyrosine phosphatase